MPDIQLPDIRLYYEEHGEGDPILCIHGTSSSALVWGAAVEPLSALGRVIVYDRRGCTRSERPAPYDSTQVSDHADDAAALLEALSAAPAIIIGRSYGGEVATDLALRYPGLVRALVLLEGAPFSLTPEARSWATDIGDFVKSVAAEKGVDAVAEAFLRRVIGDEAWESFPDTTKAMFIANTPAIIAETGSPPLEVSAKELSSIHQPTLLIAAEDSDQAFRDATAAMAEALPNARTILIGGGHFINPADPAVLDFIAEVTGRKPATPA